MLDFIFIMIAFGLGIADGGESGTSAQTPAPAAAESAGLLAGTDETMAAAAPAAPSTGANGGTATQLWYMAASSTWWAPVAKKIITVRM